MKYSLTDEINKKFTEDFLKKYMALGFGNLPKKEIDILVFGLIAKLGFLEGKDNYEISNELKIDETKVKRLKLDSALRTSNTSTLRDSLKTLRNKIFMTEEIMPEFEKDNIALLIEDPVIKRDFVYAIRSVGYAHGGNLNPERISIPIFVFIAVFCQFDDEIFRNFKLKTNKTLKRQNSLEQAYREGLPFSTKIENVLNITKPIIKTLAGVKTLLGT